MGFGGRGPGGAGFTDAGRGEGTVREEGGVPVIADPAVGDGLGGFGKSGEGYQVGGLHLRT